MKNRFVPIVASLVLLVASCGGGGGGGDANFEPFVRNLLSTTAEDTEPESINGFDFQFSEDEHAFDDLFQ